MTHRIVILNDGETFSDARGAVVVEYEGELPAEIEDALGSGDPRPLREAVADGLIAGSVDHVVEPRKWFRFVGGPLHDASGPADFLERRWLPDKHRYETTFEALDREKTRSDHVDPAAG